MHENKLQAAHVLDHGLTPMRYAEVLNPKATTAKTNAGMCGSVRSGSKKKLGISRSYPCRSHSALLLNAVPMKGNKLLYNVASLALLEECTDLLYVIGQAACMGRQSIHPGALWANGSNVVGRPCGLLCSHLASCSYLNYLN